MPSYITIIDPLGSTCLAIEIDSSKRELYETEIFDLCIDNLDVLQIISVNGDEFYLPKEVAKKYLIKINTQY